MRRNKARRKRVESTTIGSNALTMCFGPQSTHTSRLHQSFDPIFQRICRRMPTQIDQSEEPGSRTCDRNFFRALLIVVLRMIHAHAHRIFLHQGGIERLQTIHDPLGICNAGI
jgi:hypothetical protein